MVDNGEGKYSPYFQEFCCMGKERNGVIAGGGGKGSRVDFRAKEITLYLYANENDLVGGVAKQYLR